MKQKFNTLLLTLSIIGGIAFIATPQLAHAAPIGPTEGEVETTSCTNDGGVDLGEVNEGDCAETTAFKFGACKDKNVTIGCFVASTMQFMSILVGILVVAGITFGGIVYSTGGGNPGQTKKGVTIITNSVIGLVLYILMFAIINFLIPGGILT